MLENVLRSFVLSSILNLLVYPKQAISARKWALCQLTVCFEFQSRSERRQGHKSFALQLVLRSKVQS